MEIMGNARSQDSLLQHGLRQRSTPQDEHLNQHVDNKPESQTPDARLFHNALQEEERAQINRPPLPT